MADKITAGELRAWVSYDPSTGLFRFNNDVRSGRVRQFLVARAGDIAGNQSKRGYWRAAIMVGGSNRHLGYFETPEAAHEAYMGAANSAFGDFAFDGKRRA